jgi:hypothetical protein
MALILHARRVPEFVLDSPENKVALQKKVHLNEFLPLVSV